MSDQESAGQRQDRGQHTNDQRRLRDTFENLRHQIFRQRTNMQSGLRFLDAIASLDLGYESKYDLVTVPSVTIVRCYLLSIRRFVLFFTNL